MSELCYLVAPQQKPAGNCTYCNTGTMQTAVPVFAEFNASGHKWSKKYLKWHFKDTQERQRLGVSLVDIYSDIIRSFHHWKIYGDIRFQLMPVAEEEADIVIQFADKPPKTTGWTEWKIGVLAVGHFPIESIGRIAGDIYINSMHYGWQSFYNARRRGEPFKGANYDTFTVILHELGHALGLHHSDVTGAVMFATYVLIKYPFILHTDDQAGISFIYGKSKMNAGTQRRLERNISHWDYSKTA